MLLSGDSDMDSLQRARELLSTFQQEELSQIQQAAEKLEPDVAARHLDYLLRFSQLGASLQERQSPAQEVPTYFVGTLFLKDCHAYLTQGKQEFAHYVTGVRKGNSFTLDRIVTFKFSKYSVTGVEGDPADTARVLTLIDDFGHKLHAWFHSHPDMGPESYLPSPTDLRHQARLEEGGYLAIGAVFTRNGTINFFSHQRQFKVIVYGKGVIKVNETLFRFEAGFLGN